MVCLGILKRFLSVFFLQKRAWTACKLCDSLVCYKSTKSDPRLHYAGTWASDSACVAFFVFIHSVMTSGKFFALVWLEQHAILLQSNKLMLSDLPDVRRRTVHRTQETLLPVWSSTHRWRSFPQQFFKKLVWFIRHLLYNVARYDILQQDLLLGATRQWCFAIKETAFFLFFSPKMNYLIPLILIIFLCS